MRTAKRTVDLLRLRFYKISENMSCNPCSRCEIGNLLKWLVGKSRQDLASSPIHFHSPPSLRCFQGPERQVFASVIFRLRLLSIT